MNNPFAFLEELVRIPSLSGEEGSVAQFLVEQMTELGFVAQVDEAGNAIGIREMPDENGRFHTTLMLLGHMDTVPGDIPVRIEEDVLHGRGSVDAKGPLATFVQAAAQATLTPGTRLIVAGAVEEESATSKGARHLAQQFQPDLCIIGEPSGWDGVTLGYKGRLLIDCQIAVPMSHTAGEETGAAETAVAWINQLTAYVSNYNATRDRLFDQLLPSIRQIHTSSDGLTNQAIVKVGIRLPPDFVLAEFQQLVAQWVPEASLHFYAHEPAYQSTRKTVLARAFNRALRQAGTKPRYKLKTGTSDMNVVGPIWQCPIVAYGPGDSSLDHTPHEQLSLAEYERAIGVLTAVVNQLLA